MEGSGTARGVPLTARVFDNVMLSPAFDTSVPDRMSDGHSGDALRILTTRYSPSQKTQISAVCEKQASILRILYDNVGNVPHCCGSIGLVTES